MCPNYLSSLLPTTVGNATTHNLRNIDNTQTINCRTTLYFNSFLPSTIRAWNSLPNDIRTTGSVLSFKRLINRDIHYPPSYFYTRNRLADIHHTRLRTRCSSLNFHLFSKNITDNPNCTCGHIEDTDHYLLTCNMYTRQRQVLFNALMNICTPTSNTLLNGNPNMDIATNLAIFSAVHTFIITSKRFT